MPAGLILYPLPIKGIGGPSQGLMFPPSDLSVMGSAELPLFTLSAGLSRSVDSEMPALLTAIQLILDSMCVPFCSSTSIVITLEIFTHHPPIRNMPRIFVS